jgi:hypothetical protein
MSRDDSTESSGEFWACSASPELPTWQNYSAGFSEVTKPRVSRVARELRCAHGAGERFFVAPVLQTDSRSRHEAKSLPNAGQQQCAPPLESLIGGGGCPV